MGAMKLCRLASCLFAMLCIHGFSKAQNPVIQTHYSPDSAPCSDRQFFAENHCKPVLPRYFWVLKWDSAVLA